MKRNAFGQPKPVNADEIGQALDELQIDPSMATVLIDEEEDGWYAEIIGDEDASFQSGPFEDEASLKCALHLNNLEEF